MLWRLTYKVLQQRVSHFKYTRKDKNIFITWFTLKEYKSFFLTIKFRVVTYTWLILKSKVGGATYNLITYGELECLQKVRVPTFVPQFPPPLCFKSWLTFPEISQKDPFSLKPHPTSPHQTPVRNWGQSLIPQTYELLFLGNHSYSK